MKYLCAILGLLIWFIFTILIICTIIGIFLLLEEGYLDMPHKLLKAFNN